MAGAAAVWAPASQAAPGRPGLCSDVAAHRLRRRQPSLQRCRRPAVPRAQAASPQASASAPPSAAPTVRAVLFDMDGVLCDSESISRKAGSEVMKELYGLDVDPSEFIPFTGRGEAIFLGSVASKYGAPFDLEECKAKFFECYMSRYALPGAGIGHEGARELVEACRAAGLKTAVASSADRVKVDANLAAADIPLDLFDTIVSADAFEQLKPSPDIFLAAAAQLGVDPANCVVIEDAVFGVQAARAAGMRVIGVTTTLDPATMTSAAPDWIVPDVRSVTVASLLGLQLSQARQSQQQQVEQQGQQEQQALGGSHGWLDGMVDLPAGYSTTRRDLLKIASLGGAFASLYVGLSRAQRDPAVRNVLLQYHIPALVQLAIIAYVASGWQYFSKSLSYASPRALVNALFPQAQPPTVVEAGGRVPAFKRYISELEARGGGELVPEFPAGLDWLNCAPLRFSRELRGRVCVLDFWTYCCINCMHVLPDLAAIEQAYEGQPVTVVGVHSAKFQNEKDSEAIRNAVVRYDVVHPVVNDSEMVLWRGLGVSSWPTLAVVSPQGRLIAMVAGEGHREDISDIVAAALEFYGEQGLLDNTPLPLELERDKDPSLAASPLRFPGKVATDLAGGRLFIADSSNNRIVVTDLTGQFQEAIGCGAPGLLDGSFEEAAFAKPQGLAYSRMRDCLLVADVENHALRVVDFKQKTVKTVAGSGAKGSDYRGGSGGTSQLLNSPWDVVFDRSEQYAYVAMAGQHQVWRLDVAAGTIENFSGTGYERNQNGADALTTAWAQPSGLSLSPSGDSVYVADSESSTVRQLDLRTGGSQPCVGGDNLFADNLFRFGDRDGSGADALLQHPLAVLATPAGTVLVADSYNHRLKQLDTATNTIRTVAGSGMAGFKDGVGTKAQLSEPGGLAQGPDGTCYIADTNNSRIRVYDPSAQRISTLNLQGVPPPRRSPTTPLAGAAGTAVQPPVGAALVRAPNAVVAAAGEVRLDIKLPAGYHLTPGANSRFEATVLGSASGDVQLQPAAGSLAEDGSSVGALVRFSRRLGTSDASLFRAVAKVYFCKSGDVCLYEEVCFDVALAPTADAPPATVTLGYALSAQAPAVSLPGVL